MATEEGDNPIQAVKDSNKETLRRDEAEAKRLIEILEKEKKLTEDIQALKDKDEERFRRINDLKESGEELNEKQLAFLLEYNNKMSSFLLEQEKNTKSLEDAQRKYGDLTVENLQKMRKEAEEFNETIKEFERLEKVPIIGKVGGALKNAAKFNKSMADAGNSIVKFAGSLKEGSMMQKGLLRLGGNLQQGFMSAGAGVTAFGLVGVAVLAKVTKALFDFAVKMDETSKSLNAAIGINRDFKEELREVSLETAKSGVTMEEASGAIKSMALNISMFGEMSKGAEKQVTKTIARLQKLGVDSNSSAKAIDHFGRTLKMSADEAADLTAEIALMGQQSNISTSKMMENFSQLQDRIAVFGENSIEVLNNLSIQAKAAGVSVGSLTAISGKFDNFDSAVDTIAQLNAVIGTNIDAVALMQMNDDQQIQTMIRSIRMRTGSIDTLDKHTQRFIANAMGAKSVAEAQRLINMDTSEYEAYNEKQAESANIQAELARQTEELVPVMQKFKIIMNELMLKAAPLGERILKVVDALLEFSTFIESVIVFMTGAVGIGGTLIGIVKLLGIAFGVATFPISGTVAAITALIAGLAALWGWFTITGSPAMWQMPMVIGQNFGVMGTAAEKAGELLKKPIKALHGMWDIFHKSGSPDLYQLPQTFADNFASIEESVKGTMGALTKFITVMKDFASLDYDGFVAIKTDGSGTSMVMGSEGIIRQMSEGKLEVEVKMPEIKMPEININVIFNGQKLDGIIEAKVAEMVGGAA